VAGIFAACGLASDGKRDQTDVQGGASDASDDSGPGAAGTSALASGICPPLGTNPYGCLPGPTWARHLPTGTCCEYASYPSRCTPPGWPLFETEQECETSCRCAEVVPVFPDEPLDLTVERISLECGCAGVFTCPENLAAATAVLCDAPGAGVIREQKCGNILLRSGGPYDGSSYVFDAANGALVGATQSADTPRPPCDAFMTIAGRDFESCTEPTSSCILCGAPFNAADLSPCDQPPM
jgi:hypothetical protein